MAGKNTSAEFHYGGQAVIEGVMMRGKKHFAVACRRENNEIVTTTELVSKGFLGKLKWLNKPVLRGTLAMIDTLALGMKSLLWSANIAMADEQAKANGQTEDAGSEPKSSKVNEVALNATLFLSLALAILFFMFLPIRLTTWIAGSHTENRLYLGLIEGGIKLTFFFLYVWGISHMKDIRRVFQYHGAEHKTINAYEAGLELTVKNVQEYSTVHVRCGTSFLLLVIFVSIIVFTIVPWKFGDAPATGLILWRNALYRLAFKLPLLVVVAGIAYEIIKLAGNCKTSILTRVLLGPGLLMQRITTLEPSDDQVEVAIRSVQSVMQAEEEDRAQALAESC